MLLTILTREKKNQENETILQKKLPTKLAKKTERRDLSRKSGKQNMYYAASNFKENEKEHTEQEKETAN